MIDPIAPNIVSLIHQKFKYLNIDIIDTSDNDFCRLQLIIKDKMGFKKVLEINEAWTNEEVYKKILWSINFSFIIDKFKTI